MQLNRSITEWKLTIGPIFVGAAHLSANEQTVWTAGGGSCTLIGQLLPLQAVWQVSRTSPILNRVSVCQHMVCIWTTSLTCSLSLSPPPFRMFYKIKSRNAHMKIHRQPQEDWADRRLQQQLLTQRLALSLSTKHTHTPGRNLPPPQALTPIFSSFGLDVTSRNNVDADNVLNSVSVTNSNFSAHSNASILDHSAVVTISNAGAHSNSHLIPTDSGDSGLNQSEPTSVIPFHQSWSLFGHNHDPTTFYCDPEVKESVGAETGGGKDPINWQ